MRELALDLMRPLWSDLVADETLADQLARFAALLINQGALEVAASLRSVVRNHRIRAMELRGRLTILSEQYSATYHSEL